MLYIGAKEKQSFLEAQFKNFGVAAIFLFPIITFLTFRASDIMPLLFAERFKIMVLPFQIIIWSVIFLYFNYLFLKTALIINRAGIVFSSLAVEAITAIALNLYFIPRYGLEGACIATVASLIIMFGFIVFCLAKGGVRIPFYKSGEKPVVASMGLALVLHYADSWPLPLALLSGFIGYSLILIIISVLERND